MKHIKKHNSILRSFVLLFCVVSFFSCEKETTIPNNADGYITIADCKEGTLANNFNTKEVTLDAYFSKIEKEVEGYVPSSELSSFAKKLSLIVKTKKVTLYAISYHTTILGKQSLASGLVIVPKEIQSKGVLFMPYHFVASQKQAPTNEMIVPQQLYAHLGYTVIVPDYIGFGKSVKHVAPYTEKDIMGQSLTDMLFAAREFLLQKEIPTPKEISIIGYSMGGFPAIAFQNYVELSPYNTKIPIKKVYVGGGLYSLVKGLEITRKNTYTEYPIAFPLLILDLNHWHNLNLNFSLVFKEPLLSNYSQWFLSKQYGMLYLKDKLGTDIRNFMVDDVLDNNKNNIYLQLKNTLQKNEFTNWQPKAPIKIYHSKVDNYVPYENAQLFYENLKAKGADVELVTTNKPHVEGILWFYKDIITHLKIKN